HFRNGDATVTQNQHARRLLAAMAGVALDVQTEQALFRHKFNHRTVTLLGVMGITARSLKPKAKDRKRANESSANTVKTERLSDAPSRCAHELSCACLEIGVCVDDQIADTSLRGDIVNRSQEREAAPLPVHGVLTRGERHVPASAGSALPDSEANELQPGEHAVVEVQLGVGEFSGRVALLVDHELDGDVSVYGVGRSHSVLQWNRAVVVPSRPEEPHGTVTGGREVPAWRRGGGPMS